jgi:hypothetical protein
MGDDHYLGARESSVSFGMVQPILRVLAQCCADYVRSALHVYLDT